MPYRANPFLERMSERTTSDQEFVRLFSPKVLERLAEDSFEGAVHIFRSPPGGGKTTLLRAFTPTALRAFWNARWVQEMSEAYRGLVAREVLHEQEGPLVLGVFLSCASGYADLPPGATITKEGLFRALLDCRIVLRTLRSLMSLMGYSSSDQLDQIRLEYDDTAKDLKSIPNAPNVPDLLAWAEQRERAVYVELDSILVNGRPDMPADVRFEGVLWLQAVKFIVNGKVVAPKRLLMIDDLHKLRRKQRALLIEELTELRPAIPVWLAERSIALGEKLLSQGAREGRELREYSLEDIWSGGQHQFAVFAQNILDRRLEVQSQIPPGAFAQYLRDVVRPEDVPTEIEKGIDDFRDQAQRHRSNPRYSQWLEHAEEIIEKANVDTVRELYVTFTLLVRDEGKRQLSLELGPLSTEELQQRDSSQVQAAADIFMNNDLKIPYYYGIDRLCVLATGNVEELLSLAAALYDGLLAKQVLRKPDLLLSPHEQERLLREVARRKRDFIPKNHTEGARAQRLLDSIGSYCRERTFLPNAPYAPGVTGVRLSLSQLTRLESQQKSLVIERATLRRVLAECVAENLLFTRESSESNSRERGTIFYLNRALCMHYGLPLQMGGWQDVSMEELTVWMEGGRLPSSRKLMRTG
jgi:hypothetical protein